jgi:hypothetical protein
MARHSFNCKVARSTPSKLSQLALTAGFVYGTGGAVGRFLDAIAQGTLVVVKADDLKKIKKNKRGVDTEVDSS